MKPSQGLQKSLLALAIQAKKASRLTAQLSNGQKNQVLLAVASELVKKSSWIISQNKKDLKQAALSKLAPAMVDRLTLNPQRIKEMADGAKAVAGLDDPIGKTLSSWTRPNGLFISKVSVPLGVILIIYESRPNVTVDCAALCLKSGNAVILRGGREAFHSNQALVSIFEKVLSRFELPKACVSFVKTTDRKAVDFLLKREAEINLVIPRGGVELIRKVVSISRIPVVKHYQGVCHVFVDASADLQKAENIVCNAKLQRPGVCNAMETLLVHQKIAKRFLPLIEKKLQSADCEIRADQKAKKLMKSSKLAKPGDFGHEFLDRILAVKVVSDLDAAIEHIQDFGSSHTDAIVTEDLKSAQQFKTLVDSASVMVNASTRFSDGFQFGFGAEIGISTDKIHARGPMGLEGLTSYKYVVEGSGQVRT